MPFPRNTTLPSISGVSSNVSIPSDFTEAWLPTGGFAQANDGSTPCTTTGQLVKCWTGVNGTRLRNVTASNFPSFQKDVVKSGMSAMRIDSAFVASEALPGAVTIDRRNHTILILYERRITSTAPVINFNSAVNDWTVGEFHMTNGFQRPETSVLGTNQQCNYGSPLTGYAVIGLRSGSSYQWAVNNRIGRDAPGFQLTAGNYPALSVGTIPGTLSGGDLAGIWLYRYAMTAGQLVNACRGVMAYANLSQPARVKNVIYSGNSISHGIGSNFKPFADSAATAAGVSAYDYENWGQDGYTTAQLVTRDTGVPATLFRSGGTNVVVLWELTNSVGFGGTAAAALSSHASWVALWRAAGFTVLSPTVIDRTSNFTGGQNAAGFATAQGTVNTALVANSGGIYGDVIVNLNSVKAVGTAGDGTHPTQAGHDSIGGIVGTALAGVV